MAGKKKSKAALPKRIAGYKLPKSLRKSGAVTWLSKSPLAREIAAAGLVAAAAVLAKNPRVRSAAGKAGKAAAEGSEQAAEFASRVSDSIAAAITSVAHRIYPEGDQDKGAGTSPSTGKRAAPKGGLPTGNGPH